MAKNSKNSTKAAFNFKFSPPLANRFKLAKSRRELKTENVDYAAFGFCPKSDSELLRLADCFLERSNEVERALFEERK